MELFIGNNFPFRTGQVFKYPSYATVNVYRLQQNTYMELYMGNNFPFLTGQVFKYPSYATVNV